MKASSLSDLKKELKMLPPEEVLEHCIRLAKYKKENKELLTYLLFEANDEQEYIRHVQQEIDAQFEEINKSNIYYAKKSIRKILRFANKHCKYSGQKQTETELLIYFCRKLKDSGVPVKKNLTLQNLYDRQLQRIDKAVKTLHEDLQHDYEKEIEKL